jgi:hypothetical protein
LSYPTLSAFVAANPLFDDFEDPEDETIDFT